MAIFNTLRAELCDRLQSAVFDSLDLTTVASEYAQRLSPCMINISVVGSDFVYGRGRVHMLPNHTWTDYGCAAMRIGTAPLEALCASAGAINIGIYGNKLVLKHAWQVRPVSCAIPNCTRYLSLTHRALFS